MIAFCLPKLDAMMAQCTEAQMWHCAGFRYSPAQACKANCGKCRWVLAGVRKLGSIGHNAKQSVDAFVEAVGQKDALQELQVGPRLRCSCVAPCHSNGRGEALL